MVILYTHNFRGFTDTFIKLEAVNFFLGENSTGKTSILSLLNILSKEKFWLSQDFNTDEVELGYFSEILSANSNENYFEVGLFDYKSKNKSAISAFYMKFIEDNGSPMISEYRFLLGGTTFLVRKHKDNIEFSYTNDFVMPKSSDDYLDFYKNWIKAADKKLVQDFKELKINMNIPLLFLPSILINEIEPKKSKKNNQKGNILPIFLQDLTWIAPIRAKPKRNYDGYKINFSSEGEHIPHILKSIFQNNGEENTNNLKNDLKNNLEKFGLDSGLFKKIEIKSLGNEKNSPFEINIILNQTPIKITNVGYGVSQILPIIVEILVRRNSTCFAIQQPEVHIHPKGQAALGELFFILAQNGDKAFIIETHSDFIVDRYRLALRKHNKQEKNKITNAQVLFFERTDTGNIVHHLPIDEQGDYPEEQPTTFRDFFFKEQFNLLSY
jgi:predicted ATPase